MSGLTIAQAAQQAASAAHTQGADVPIVDSESQHVIGETHSTLKQRRVRRKWNRAFDRPTRALAEANLMGTGELGMSYSGTSGGE